MPVRRYLPDGDQYLVDVDREPPAGPVGEHHRVFDHGEPGGRRFAGEQQMGAPAVAERPESGMDGQRPSEAWVGEVQEADPVAGVGGGSDLVDEAARRSAGEAEVGDDDDVERAGDRLVAGVARVAQLV